MCTGDTIVWLFIAVLSLLKHFSYLFTFILETVEKYFFFWARNKSSKLHIKLYVFCFSAFHLVLRDFILFFCNQQHKVNYNDSLFLFPRQIGIAEGQPAYL